MPLGSGDSCGGTGDLFCAAGLSAALGFSGADSAFFGAGASLLAEPPLPAVSSLITSVPCLTLSPALMKTSFTVPAWVEGTSIVALSVSRVIRPSSFSMVSPTETNTSITSTSPSSPISGTSTSTTPPADSDDGADEAASSEDDSAEGAAFSELD